jgi:hypothetical protein
MTKNQNKFNQIKQLTDVIIPVFQAIGHLQYVMKSLNELDLMVLTCVIEDFKKDFQAAQETLLNNSGLKHIVDASNEVSERIKNIMSKIPKEEQGEAMQDIMNIIFKA